jgi:hypothetical protein
MSFIKVAAACGTTVRTLNEWLRVEAMTKCGEEGYLMESLGN